MSTIPKERLEQLASGNAWYCVQDDEAAELARIALASLEAEPYGYVHKAAYEKTGSCGLSNDREAYRYSSTHVAVYTAPPASVSVPAAMEMDDDFDSAFEHGKAVGWNAYRAAMFQSGNFRENKNSSTNNFREIAETSTNSPLIPGEVLSAIREVARIRADFDDFDGDRRGIGDCLDEAEQELIVTINKYASQLAAEPIATNDVREQTAVPPIQADVAQAIENLKQKLVECNRYNYCADAVKNVEDACHAAMLQGSQPVSQTYKLPVNTPCQDAPAHIWLQTAGVWPEDGELSELTWCSHNQHHDDTLYVRADLVNGNSPVTPDGWISCSDRMPEIRQTVIGWNGYAVRQCVYTRNEYAKTQKGREPRFEILTGIWHGVTHWMPLPEPPQEVNRG